MVKSVKLSILCCQTNSQNCIDTTLWHDVICLSNFSWQ